MRIFLCLLLAVLTHAADPATEKLGAEMGARISRVPEFEFIREEAKNLGVRVYFFGGTAAAYGHYVRQDLAREAGDKRYPDFLYDYDYTNIFRSTQDLDIVVDGSAEKAQALEKALKTKFPHFVGDKAAQWEVRPLTEARGDKDAILHNPDFQNQHTDSHSTGLVEVTPTPAGESAVKDARDWAAKEPQFLKDVAEQKLHYYFNPLHETTKRAKEGLNPPILSAIRYLTKAFQYDLAIGPEEEAQLQKVIEEFKPADLKNTYVQKWVEKNGKKLFQHAVDLEYAWTTLEKLGLRKKLIALQHNPEKLDSLSWWMNKQPLRGEALGQGKGRTAAQLAKELGLDSLVVAHETKSYLAYESITRSKSGDLNAFISREGAEGESAVHGDGFYTKLGRSGARGTGLTIRMVIDPQAREGTDFKIGGGYYIIQNRNAVKVIPEAINISLPAYFTMLKNGEDFSADDRALYETFKRKMGRAALIAPEEEAEILALVKGAIKNNSENRMFFRAWFDLPLSAHHPEILAAVIARPNSELQKALFDSMGNNPHWLDHPDWVKEIIEKYNIYDHTKIVDFLSRSGWERYPELIRDLLKKGTADSAIATLIAGNPRWENEQWIVDELIEKDYVHNSLALALKDKSWPGRAEWMDKLIASGKADKYVTTFLLSDPKWGANPKWIQTLLDRGSVDSELAEHVLDMPHWKDHPEFVEALVNKGTVDKSLARGALYSSQWNNYPQWMKTVIARGHADIELINFTFSGETWVNHHELLVDMIARGHAKSVIGFLEQDHWRNTPKFGEITKELANDPNNDVVLVQKFLATPGKFPGQEEILYKIIARCEDTDVMSRVLMNPAWLDHPELLEAFLRNPISSKYPGLVQTLIRGWEKSPAIKAMMGSTKITRENLYKKFAEGFTFLPKTVAPASCAGKFAEVIR